MVESGNHHSQQTDTSTENQILHRQVLNNENIWTQKGSVTHWGLLHGGKGGTGGWGGWGGKTLGEMPVVGDEGTETANHHGM